VNGHQMIIFGHSWALMDIRVFMAADAQMT
jgi:hypothetical protein